MVLVQVLLLTAILRKNLNSYFLNNEINLSNIKNKTEFLFKLGLALGKLSKSDISKSFLFLGGIYHKKYYNIINNAFCNEKSIVFYQKNAVLSVFLYNLKYNLCSYGIYFYLKNNKLYLKIYAGGSVVLSKYQQNFINNFIYDYKKNINLCGTKNHNLKEIQDKFKIENVNINLSLENKFLAKLYKNKFNENSKILVKVFEDLNYEIYFENEKIDKFIFFKSFKKVEENDFNIEKIIKEDKKRVVNSLGILYNEDVLNFDIIKTINFIGRRANDKTYRELVQHFK